MLKFIIAGVFMFALSLVAAPQLKPGDAAPDFSLPDADGKIHTLKEYRGKIVVLYFYPKDDTPGCTAEACNIRDNYAELQKAGLVILGVSYDDASSHRKFAGKYKLPFPLLSDTKKEVAAAYGAKGTLTGFLVAQRKTFLIDKDGKILHIFNKVQTNDHTRQILDILKELHQSPDKK